MSEWMIASIFAMVDCTDLLLSSFLPSSSLLSRDYWMIFVSFSSTSSSVL